MKDTNKTQIGTDTGGEVIATNASPSTPQNQDQSTTPQFWGALQPFWSLTTLNRSDESPDINVENDLLSDVVTTEVGVLDDESLEEAEVHEVYVVDQSVTEVVLVVEGRVVSACFCKVGGITIFSLSKRNLRRCRVIFLFSLIIAVIAGILIIFLFGNKSDKTGSLSSTPSLALSFPPTQHPTYDAIDKQEPRSLNISKVIFEISDEGAFFDPFSPQSKALRWVILHDPLVLNYNESSLIQRYALMVFYYSLKGEEWYTNTGFGSGNHECKWFGVTCGHEGYPRTFDDTIMELDFSLNNLVGTLPKEIETFTSLVELKLMANRINGSIPNFIWSIPSLLVLQLERNFLEGTILGAIEIETDISINLNHVFLNGNKLTGTLSTNINRLTRLNSFEIEGNAFTGSLPSTLDALRLLQRFKASYNQLSGTIPSEIGLLRQLEVFMIDNNKISGSIPNELMELSFLKELKLGHNRIIGTLPSPQKESWVTHLDLSYNRLGGAIPNARNFPFLVHVDLQKNNFEGSIPSERFVNLEYFDLSNNRLIGTVPMELGGGVLDKFSVLNNSIFGTIPNSLCGISKLQADCGSLSGFKVSCSCCTYCG